MSTLRDRLMDLIPKWRADMKEFAGEFGDAQVATVTLKQVLGGARGIRALICDTSSVEPDRGLVIRGIHVKELTDRLPEEILWLLLTGSLPNEAELNDLQADLKKRAKVPEYVWDVLEAMPKDSHPMCMFDTAILVMERESKFRKQYNEGLKKGMLQLTSYSPGRSNTCT